MTVAPFFIVASARSGTTWLRLMLNAHPEIAVPPESRFITELWMGHEKVPAKDFLDTLTVHKRFAAWDLPPAEVRAELGDAAEVLYAQAIDATYRAYAKTRGKKSWGDKTPRYVEHIPFIAALFPEARFIHLVRDGRDVALSYADVPFGPKTVAGAARLWKQRVAAGIRDGRPLGPKRYLEVRYEALVADDEGEARRICDFLGVAFTPLILSEEERKKGALGGRAERFNPSATKAAMTRLRSWREEMPPGHVELFEVVAGDVLEELGYERRFPRPGPRARASAKLAALGLPLGRLKARRPSRSPELP